MMANWPKELVTAGCLLKRTLEICPRDSRAALLYGFLATTVGQVDEIVWTQAMEDSSKPCGVPGCDCEKVREPVMRAMDTLRRDYLQMVEKQGGFSA